MRISGIISIGILLLIASLLATGPAISRTLYPRPAAAGTAAAVESPGLPSLPEGWPDSLAPLFYYTEGVKRAHIYGDVPGAMEALTRAMELDSLHAPSYFEAADILMDSDRARALGYSMKAGKLDTANLWYKGQLAELMVSNGEYRQAQAIYEELIKRSPHNPDNYAMLAVLFEYAGQPFSAITTLDRAESVLGKMEHIAAYKRKLLVDVKLYDRAIDENRALLDIYPHDYESHLSLAQLYAMRGRDSLAESSFARALELNPGSPEVLLAMNEYYKTKGDDPRYISTAKELFRSRGVPAEVKVKWLKDAFNNTEFCRTNYFHIREMASTAYLMYPRDYEVLDAYSQTLIFSGELETALEYHKAYLTDTLSVTEPYTDIIDMEAYLGRADSVRKYADLAVGRFPGNSDLYLRQGSAYRYMGEDKKAFAAYANALKYAQDDSTRSMMAIVIGGYHREKGNDKKAVASYRKGVEHAGDGKTKSVVLGVLGDYYHEKGDDTKAFGYYREALSCDPENVVVLNNFAYYLSLVGKDLEEALKMTEKVMELEGSNPTYIDTYGWVLYKLGRYEEAKKAIRQAIALDTENSAELLLHYGDILAANGESYMATVYWKRALEAGADAAEVERRMVGVEK